MLPVWKSHLLHDFINVRDDPLDDDMGILAFGFFKQFRQGFLCTVPLLHRIDILLSLKYFLRQFENLLQELEAGEKALFVALLDLFKTFSQRGEFGVAKVLP